MNSIDEVLQRLDAIIGQSIQSRSPGGYFPALYRRVTAAVKQDIERGAFDSNERMEQLDIHFAQRYFDAFENHAEGKPVTHSWKAAFAGQESPSLIVLQHLLLGMNAHISLDLGISTAAIADRGDPLAIKEDFFRINAILGSFINDTQKRLTRVFGPLGVIDHLLGDVDESLSLFSIEYARDKAWTQALELIVADEPTREALIAQRDKAVAGFSSRIARPRNLTLRLLIRLIRLAEKGDLPWRIEVLKNHY
ncbi:MAG TPA: DUF5995 family protein [Oceanipulchritudo sp.]|nr:DUF5995 family protein [Oceanipulchritudo sp.]